MSRGSALGTAEREIRGTDVTLHTRFPQSDEADAPTWTLAEAFAELRRRKLTRLFAYGQEWEMCERAVMFKHAVRDGRVPRVGQVLAAWYCPADDDLLSKFAAGGMTTAQFDARRGSITRRVFYRAKVLGSRFPVLTVHQPWAWAISDGPKRAGHRSWFMSYRGLLWLHVGRCEAWDAAGERSPLVRRAWVAYACGRPAAEWPMAARGSRWLLFGAVVALVMVTGCHHWSECGPCSAWGAVGQFHIELVEAVERLAEPFPVRGHQGLWYLPASAEVACLAQLPGRAAR